ncbi:MAG: hypothetical protein WBP45_09785 [Daejeonella sp.]
MLNSIAGNGQVLLVVRELKLCLPAHECNLVNENLFLNGNTIENGKTVTEVQ